MNSDLIGSMLRESFEPKRHAQIVKLVRRLLYPFIRPFLAFTLMQIQLQQEAQEKLAAQILELKRGTESESFTEWRDTISADVKAGQNDILNLAGEILPRFTQPIVDFRSDVAALVNRHRIVSEDIHDIREQLEQLRRTCSPSADLEDLREKVRQISQTFGSTADINELRERLGQLSQTCSELAVQSGISSNQREILTVVRGDLDLINDQLGSMNLRMADFASSVDSNKDHLDNHSLQLEAFGQRLSSATENADEAVRSSRIRIISANDGLFVVRRGDLISESVSSNGAWDEHIVQLMDDIALKDPKGLALDIGAQFGILTVAMARRFKNVICFEPNDFHFRMLVANIALNGVTNVACHNYPLFSSELTLSLGRPDQQETPVPLDTNGRYDPMSAPNSSSYMFTQDGIGTYNHRARTLDSLELQGVSFMKIDVQGADGEVLMGSRKTIERCRPVVVFEWEEHLARSFSTSFEQVRDMLRSLGYRAHSLKRHNEKQADYVAYYLGAGLEAE